MENNEVLVVYKNYNEKLHGHFIQQTEGTDHSILYVEEEPTWKKLSEENETLKRLVGDQSKGISDLVELKGHLIAEIALNKAIISKYRENNVEHQNELLQEENKKLRYDNEKLRTLIRTYELSDEKRREEIEYFVDKSQSMLDRNKIKDSYIRELEELVDRYKPAGLGDISFDVMNGESDVEYFHRKLIDVFAKEIPREMLEKYCVVKTGDNTFVPLIYNTEIDKVFNKEEAKKISEVLNKTYTRLLSVAPTTLYNKTVAVISENIGDFIVWKLASNHKDGIQNSKRMYTFNNVRYVCISKPEDCCSWTFDEVQVTMKGLLNKNYDKIIECITPCLKSKKYPTYEDEIKQNIETNTKIDQRKVVDEINYHNECAKATLGEMKKITIEDVFPKHNDPPITDAVLFADWLRVNKWNHRTDGNWYDIYNNVKPSEKLYEEFIKEVLKTPNGKFGEFYKKPLIPLDAHDIEVFHITDSYDSPTGRKAYIGFKNKENDFHYISVTYTDPYVPERIRKANETCNRCTFYTKTGKENGICGYKRTITVNASDSCKHFIYEQNG